jgi:hypothetical protein
MPLLETSRTLEEDAKAVTGISSHILISTASLGFWAIIVIDIGLELFIYGIPSIIATIYAVQTLIAKRNLDYRLAMRCSRFTKIWAVAAYILGIFCLLAQAI